MKGANYMLNTIWHNIVIIHTWTMNNILWINILLSIVIVFFQRREPSSVWAWLLVLNCIPIVGFFLYLLLGQDMHKNHMFRVKGIEDEINLAIKAQTDTFEHEQFSFKNKKLNSFLDLVLHNVKYGAFFSDNNSVDIITDGNKKFEQLLADINAATKYIHIQYYIIKPGEPFDRILEALKQKASEGVEVRLLVDAMGGRFMSKRYIKKIKSYGIKVGIFFPAFLGKFQLRVNYRNHRKLVIIDGKYSYVGGFNIGSEYIGLDPKFGYWRDTHLRVQGNAIHELQARFALDWNYATKENLLINEKYFEATSPTNGNVPMQIISSGPDSKKPLIRDNYLRLLSKAKKSIYIQTPYFVPDDTFLDTLKIVAESGVDVRIMIPCKPDHPFVYWATYSFIGDMLASGVKCYTYDNGFLHAKGIMIDGLVSSYGSANMDCRSFKLNFEVNAVIYDADITSHLEDIFLTDLKEHCTEITPYRYNQRSLLIKFKEQISRLLTPVL